jgi:2-dehydro-3-deoxyglucarate aldolase/4-hydroxy-2-oxoheptanedioate aldolase
MPYLTSANAETIVMVAVETTEAVENLDEILSVDDLDGIFIGPMDLASSMGHLGNPGHPDAQKQIAIIEEKVLASDKFLGTVAATWDKASDCFDRGYQWLIVMQDGAALLNAGKSAVSEFRGAFGDG